MFSLVSHIYFIVKLQENEFHQLDGFLSFFFFLEVGSSEDSIQGLFTMELHPCPIIF